jgi:CheY-like chemotaxis protein
MPGLSGIEFSRLVAAMHPAIKVVIMSGYTENGRKQFDEADAAVVLVQKPLVPSELVRKVREVLDGTKK